MYQQQTCTVRNVKGSHVLQTRKMISGRNIDLHKGIQNCKNGNCMGKYMVFTYLKVIKR